MEGMKKSHQTRKASWDWKNEQAAPANPLISLLQGNLLTGCDAYQADKPSSIPICTQYLQEAIGTTL